MDPNVAYWCVVGDQHNNIVPTGGTFIIQTADENEIHYTEDNSQSSEYIQSSEPEVEEHLPVSIIHRTVKQKKIEPFWDKNKTKLLLNLVFEFKLRNVNDSNRNKWTELALLVDTTTEECIRKFSNLRRTYVRLLKKKRQGREIKWIYFPLWERIFDKVFNSENLDLWEDHRVHQFLDLYIQNLDRFRDPDCIKKNVWNEIALALGTTYYNCYHKFKSLKRTYISLKEKHKETGKVSKWQFHHYFERIFRGNYTDKVVGPWDRNKTKLLLTSYAALASKFQNPRYQKKELWLEISHTVGESPSSCDRKFRNLKQTYLTLKKKLASGGTIIKWKHYKDFEDIYNQNHNDTKGDFINITDDYIKRLLCFYIANLNEFRNPRVKKNNLWKQIAPKIGMNANECDKKFRNLKQTYIRLREKQNETGKSVQWPYFSYFQRIFNNNHSAFANSSAPYSCEFQKDQSDKNFSSLIKAVQESNDIQRERNRILLNLLDKQFK